MSAQTAVKEESKKVGLGRQVRASVLREFQGAMSGVETVVVAKIDRVPTRDINQLRQKLSGMDSNFLIIKNSLGRLTFRRQGWEAIEKTFEGTCGVAPVRGDVAATAKLLTTFAKDHEGFVLRGGILQGQVMEPKEWVALANLPSRQVLLAKLAGLAQAPMRNLAVVLQAPIRSLAMTLAALGQKRKKE